MKLSHAQLLDYRASDGVPFGLRLDGCVVCEHSKDIPHGGIGNLPAKAVPEGPRFATLH